MDGASGRCCNVMLRERGAVVTLRRSGLQRDESLARRRAVPAMIFMPQRVMHNKFNS